MGGSTPCVNPLYEWVHSPLQVMSINGQTLLILIVCVLILWWTTDYTPCNREHVEDDPLPHDPLKQSQFNARKETSKQKGGMPTTSHPKTATEVDISEDMKREKIKGSAMGSQLGACHDCSQLGACHDCSQLGACHDCSQLGACHDCSHLGACHDCSQLGACHDCSHLGACHDCSQLGACHDCSHLGACHDCSQLGACHDCSHLGACHDCSQLGACHDCSQLGACHDCSQLGACHDCSQLGACHDCSQLGACHDCSQLGACHDCCLSSITEIATQFSLQVQSNPLWSSCPGWSVWSHKHSPTDYSFAAVGSLFLPSSHNNSWYLLSSIVREITKEFLPETPPLFAQLGTNFGGDELDKKMAELLADLIRCVLILPCVIPTFFKSVFQRLFFLRSLGVTVLSLANKAIEPKVGVMDVFVHALQGSQLEWVGLRVKSSNLLALGGMKVGVIAFCTYYAKCKGDSTQPLSPAKYTQKAATSTVRELRKVFVQLHECYWLLGVIK